MKTLKAKLQGTWNYYGLIGNYRRMKLLYDETCRRCTSGSTGGVNAKASGGGRSIVSCNVSRCPNRASWKEWSKDACQRDFSFCQRLLTWPVMHPSAHARAS